MLSMCCDYRVMTATGNIGERHAMLGAQHTWRCVERRCSRPGARREVLAAREWAS